MGTVFGSLALPKMEILLLEMCSATQFRAHVPQGPILALRTVEYLHFLCVRHTNILEDRVESYMD